MFTDQADADTLGQRQCCQQPTNCLVCYDRLDSHLILNKGLSQTWRCKEKPSDHQELFEIFCDYMELDYDSFSHDSDPVHSTFPFCPVCEVMLMDLCELHDEMKHLVSRATQIKATLVGVILESSNSKYIPSIPSDLTSNTDLEDDTEIIRKIITKRYTTEVVIQSRADPSIDEEKSRSSKIKGNPGAQESNVNNVVPDSVENCFDDALNCGRMSFQCPSPDNSEDWEDISGSGGSSSEHGLEQQQNYPAKSPSATTANNPIKTRSDPFFKMKTIAESSDCNIGKLMTGNKVKTGKGTCSKPKEAIIIKSKKKPESASVTEVKEGGKNYEKICTNKYMYAGEFPFEKNGDKYRCELCNIFKPSLAKIQLHMRRSHHLRRPSTKRYHKFVEIQPNKFIYGNKLAVYKIKKNFHCCSCAFKTIRRDEVIRHLRTKHLESDEDRFQGGEVQMGGERSSIKKNLDLESLFSPIAELNEHLNENNSCKEDEGDIQATGKLNVPKLDSEVDDCNDSEDQMGLNEDVPQPGKKLWEEIGEGKFLYRKRLPFSKVGDQYFCGSVPCTNMSPTFRQILTHVRRCHIYERIPGKARIRFTHKLVETGPGQFIYANQYHVELSDGVYTCGTCQQTSTNKYTLVEHVRRKHLNPRQELICETCGKIYTCQKNFCVHKRMHQNQACYVCKICGSSFAQPEYLRRHMRASHMGDEVKKYVCEFCGKKFRAKINLIGHTSTHTGEKSFGCSHCPMVFRTYNSMLYHRVRAHGDEKVVNL